MAPLVATIGLYFMISKISDNRGRGRYVKVIRARDLVPRDLNGKSDPYVVLDLVPDL